MAKSTPTQLTSVTLRLPYPPSVIAVYERSDTMSEPVGGGAPTGSNHNAPSKERKHHGCKNGIDF